MPRIIDRPEVFLISQPKLDWSEIRRYLKKVGDRTDTNPEEWANRVQNEISDGEALVEVGGRLCYRSWVPGANINVTKVREDSRVYLGNILKSGHGSVIEHANYSFIFDDVSRVFTHEQVRHRAGVAVSQESMRFVRLDNISFWFPEWARKDPTLMTRSIDLLLAMEEHQLWMADRFKLDETERPCTALGCVEGITYDEDTPMAGQIPTQYCKVCKGEGVVPVDFSEKKHKTSFMRRFAPDGVATGMLCTINIRAIRHIVYMRTALGAEEEIRLVMDDVARLALEATPNLMQDYSSNEDQEWIPEFLKV